MRFSFVAAAATGLALGASAARTPYGYSNSLYARDLYDGAPASLYARDLDDASLYIRDLLDEGYDVVVRRSPMFKGSSGGSTGGSNPTSSHTGQEFTAPPAQRINSANLPSEASNMRDTSVGTPHDMLTAGNSESTVRGSFHSSIAPVCLHLIADCLFSLQRKADLTQARTDRMDNTPSDNQKTDQILGAASRDQKSWGTGKRRRSLFN